MATRVDNMAQSAHTHLDYGWSAHWQNLWTEQGRTVDGLEPARIVREDRGAYVLACSTGMLEAELSGKVKRTGRKSKDYPVVGDWVAIDLKHRRIELRLPRRSIFSRKARGEYAQHVGANVDEVFVMVAADDTFNRRRLERYLVLAWESGAIPTVVLSKVDLRTAEQITIYTNDIVIAAEGCAHVRLSIHEGMEEGVETLRKRLTTGKSFAVVGASGVGKSTLANKLFGEQRMAVGEVRSTDLKGRHTTVHRELIWLPCGALLLDTPGMREVAMWGVGDGLPLAFPEIAREAESCRFNDCAHKAEPGCAVRKALETGDIGADRFAHFVQLTEEFAALNQRSGR